MTKQKPLNKRKVLENRCPHCDSSQIHHRKLIGNWKCKKCKHVFKRPKPDKVKE